MPGARQLQPRGDRGAAAVEFALVLLPLLLVVYGIIDFGRAYNAQETLTQAARVGARLAVVGHTDADVKTAVVNAASTLSGLSASNVTVNNSCGTSNPVSATVKVDYSFQYLTPLFSSGITITGRATAPC